MKKLHNPPEVILDPNIKKYLFDIQQVINVTGDAVTSISISTTETATGSYGTNERDMLNNLKADVNALAVGLNSLLTALRTAKVIDT
jgi:hypothetical protein